MIKALFILIVKGYQKLISPLIGQRCRFYPSCSNYAVDALKTHNIFKAFYLITIRLLKCGPWHSGGLDFVPGSEAESELRDDQLHTDL